MPVIVDASYITQQRNLPTLHNILQTDEFDVEVAVENLDQRQQAFNSCADVAMPDDSIPDQMVAAVAMAAHRLELGKSAMLRWRRWRSRNGFRVGRCTDQACQSCGFVHGF